MPTRFRRPSPGSTSRTTHQSPLPPRWPATVLRVSCVVIVAGVFMTAGLQNFFRPDRGITIMTRLFQNGDAVRAIGLMQGGVALWLLSNRRPKLCATVAGGILVGFAVLALVELTRANRLPLGGILDYGTGNSGAAVGQRLKVAAASHIFLVLLVLISVVLLPGDDRESTTVDQS